GTETAAQRDRHGSLCPRTIVERRLVPVQVPGPLTLVRTSRETSRSVERRFDCPIEDAPDCSVEFDRARYAGTPIRLSKYEIVLKFLCRILRQLPETTPELLIAPVDHDNCAPQMTTPLLHLLRS